MLAHLLYSFVTEEYPQVFIKTYQKNLRVPCLFRCLIFKVRCLLKKGRFVSYHIIAALSTPFFLPVRVFYPRTVSSCWHSFSRLRSSCALCTPFRFPSRRVLDHSIKPLPFCQYLFPPFSPSLYTPPRVARPTGTRTSTQKEKTEKTLMKKISTFRLFLSPSRRLSMKIKLNKRGALFFILIIVYPSIMSLI